ncbi:MAG: hypothetical protein LW832_10275 [Parachlamydia sp.]|nr:hypothetical protein [Parachlamydia sp.]
MKIILGHIEEALPYLLWRFDSRFSRIHSMRELKKPLSHYIRENFFVTTSGVYANGPLLCAMRSWG